MAARCNSEAQKQNEGGRLFSPTALVRLFVLLGVAYVATAYAGQPRSAAERAAFKRENSCPSTGLRRGACPGWQVDHITPLCAGGADHRINMQWILVDDHRFKTLVDVKECRRSRKPAQASRLPDDAILSK